MEPLSVGMVTLLVGKNASGKSRTLNVLWALAGLVAGATKLVFKSGNYLITFVDDKSEYEYALRYTDQRVAQEKFSRDKQLLLERGPGGSGKLLAFKTGQMLEFQTPDSELAAVTRRDSIQHPYFENLYSWGKGVRHFQFGTSLGKDRLVYLTKDKPSTFDPRNTADVISVFRRGLEEFGDDFTRNIVSDMAAIGYKLEEVGLRPPESITVTIEPFTPSGELVGLYVKEQDLSGLTDQVNMSQGMFRALSVIIHLNYSQRSEQPSCILIDDVGEGLDFDRSCALIDLLMRKSQEGGVQLIMSTNDRFVMNRVPLQYWSVIHRDGNVCRFFNYENSRDKFEAFKLTGMNNFDFFATDFVRSKLGEEVSNLR
jgi:energy-coupling factor transporter ATP-binding protein EcfA2